jgi:hypothetical protein
MIKFPTIKELKDMWDKSNSNKKNNQEEKPNSKHEEYLEITTKKADS